ncbi:MAG: glutamate synthase-related protein [Ignavibacteriales bacterium]
MPLLDRVYEKLVNQVIEKLSHMKNVKAPPFVENFPFTTMMAIAERAKSGTALSEPLGSTRNFRDFRDLMFVPSMFPTVDGTPIDLSVTLGKHCAKPFNIPVPFMLSAYGYGVSVSKKVKVALAMASAMAGTATNSGEGGYLPEERKLASRYIVQYNRAGWGNGTEELRGCDMVEIRMGQGASAGDGFRIRANAIDEELRDHLKLKKGEDAVMPSRFPDINNEGDLRRKVPELRDITQGVPVALKIAAGDIEKDLDTAVSAGVDVVVLDGAQGGDCGKSGDHHQQFRHTHALRR